MTSRSTLESQDLPWSIARTAERPRLELVIAWSLDEPHRIGEGAPIEQVMTLGRDDPEVAAPFARFRPWRPAGHPEGRALRSPRISRVQLRLRPSGDTLAVENVGRSRLLVNGEEQDEAEVSPGDTLTLRNVLVLLVVRREGTAGARVPATFPFGEPDPYGLIGESPAAWRLREDLAFAASGDQHVLIHGASGVGKEIAARAVHAMSRRGARALVARNAATFPEGLVDAELFGTARNYPNSGSPERLGLVGEADGSSLFLDEIGELPHAMQAHLLRVLDRGGEFQRLGDARMRRSDLRILAATNRPLDSLKHDFLARFTTRIALPGLEERREDIPLLLAAQLARAAAESDRVRERFFDASGRARLHPDLVEVLLRHRYKLHVRELAQLLWQALASSTGDFVALTPDVEAAVSFSAPTASTPPDKAAVEAALASAGGKVSVAAEALGLSSRFVLYRLMKRYGIGE